jgi:hypothetical protein
MIERQGLRLRSALAPATTREIEKLSPSAIELARRWAKETPDRVRELEASGSLISTLKKHADEEALRQRRARLRTLSGRRDLSPPG